MEFTVSRDGTTLVTLHEGSDTTACDAATDELTTTLDALAADDRIRAWTIDDADVYEPPTAPFDPYTIAVDFTVTVTVAAETADAATDIGAATIEEALETGDVDAVSYTSSPAASAAS